MVFAAVALAGSITGGNALTLRLQHDGKPVVARDVHVCSRVTFRAPTSGSPTLVVTPRESGRCLVTAKLSDGGRLRLNTIVTRDNGSLRISVPGGTPALVSPSKT